MTTADLRVPRVVVVVLNYNGLDDTLKCLDSLRQLTAPATIIVVDNKSTVDPEPAVRTRHPGVVLIHNDDNLGYAGGNNRGIEAALVAGADYVLVLNNDTTVAPTLVDRLLGAFGQDPSLGIVGPVINYLDEPERVMTEGANFNRGPGWEFFSTVAVPQGPDTARPTAVDIVNGCCMMIRSDLLRRIGGFDETLFIVHEESDLCLRARAAGYGCAVVPQTLVWHKGSSSFTRVGRSWQRYYDTRNLLILIGRHRRRSVPSHGFFGSVFRYLRYAYHRHEIEREAGQDAAAAGVVEGVTDALTGRTGPYAPGSRPMAWLVRLMFSLARVMSRSKRLGGAAAAGRRPS